MALTDFSLGTTLPTNYEYYTSGGINSGLNATDNEFTLNEKLIRIYSGAMHYFRVPRKYWRDRLKKIRAAGLNTVESYVPWNLHEPQSGVYDFGEGGSEMEDFLHVEEFLQTAKEEDLFVILRPGPYISAEYNFGGFPSWLLREKPMGFRTSESNYMKYVSRYFNVLLPLLALFQFTKGGPVIAFQVENEYGYVEDGSFEPDKVYLEQLRQLYIDNNIVELLVTSDGPLAKGLKGTIPGEFLMTGNFGSDPDNQLAKLEEIQPGRPLMVMEFWIGWFDYWGATSHVTRSLEDATDAYTRILEHNASVNIYMFHGATNFGSLNGAGLTNRLNDNSGFRPITTSYDYDAPLAEDGSYTDKYYMVKELIAKYNPVQTLVPDAPEATPVVAYESISLTQQLTFESLLQYNYSVSETERPIAMENLPINNNSGQSYGYIVYRKENVDLPANSTLTIEGHVCDTLLILVNGELVAPTSLTTADDLDGFGFWRLENSSVTLNSEALKGATIDLVVEEWGRMHGGIYYQYNQTFKGLWQGEVILNEEVLSTWLNVPMEFKRNWINSLSGWTSFSVNQRGATLYSAVLDISEEPNDTYLDMSGWSKGSVFVNGIALGKYAAIGPQQALYLPAPFLQTGANNISVFEHFAPPTDGLLRFSDKQIWESK